MVAKKQIPVIVVAGFLGSGKTTLLNHLLRNNDGVRIGVIVNDFGSVNIDSMMVAGQVDSMVSLSNGCLCCAVDVSDMDEMLNKLAHRQSGIDVIVIEASGLAEPRNMIRLVLGSENPSVVYGGPGGPGRRSQFLHRSPRTSRARSTCPPGRPGGSQQDRQRSGRRTRAIHGRNS